MVFRTLTLFGLILTAVLNPGKLWAEESCKISKSKIAGKIVGFKYLSKFPVEIKKLLKNILLKKARTN